VPNGSQFEEDEYEDDELEDSSLVKDLRKQIKDLSKTNGRLEKKLNTFVTQQRGSALADLLKDKGVSPAAAKFYPADADVDEESVTAWITENQDALGPIKVADDATPTETPSPGEGQPQAVAPDGQQLVEIPSFVAPEDRAAFARMQAAQLVGTSATTRDAEMVNGIKQCKTAEELTAFLSSQR
jgi:hypothetical protein